MVLLFFFSLFFFSEQQQVHALHCINWVWAIIKKGRDFLSKGCGRVTL